MGAILEIVESPVGIFGLALVIAVGYIWYRWVFKEQKGSEGQKGPESK